MIKKSRKEMSLGDIFIMNTRNPEGYIKLKVIGQHLKDEPLCEVIEHHYDEPAEDEYDEEDRYKVGDEMIWFWDGHYDIINS